MFGKHMGVRSVLIAAAVGSLLGCGGDLMATDSIVENDNAEAFLDRVEQECAKHSIGGWSMKEMLGSATTNPQGDYFVDLTTKLYEGKISKAAYASNVDAFFPRGNNQDAVECTFSQLQPKPAK